MAMEVATLTKYISADRLKLSSDTIQALVSKEAAPLYDSVKHLQYESPSHRFSMTEVGLDPASTKNKHGCPAVCDFAYTKPFRLLSSEGVEAMRKAVLSDRVLQNCPMQLKDRQGKDYTHWELRNGAKHSSFIRDFWSSDAVTAAMCDALQFDVVPTMDMEKGHVNLQAPNQAKYEDGVTGWHTDTNTQFVCILMLSDPTHMVGGETAFRRGDGSIALVRYPEAGYAIMMQGLNIMHSVTEVLAGTERMTMVTSYQPADHMVAQNGRIRGIHCMAPPGDKHEMLADYASWRLKVLSTRMAALAQQVEQDRGNNNFDIEGLKDKAAELQNFLQITLGEVC